LPRSVPRLVKVVVIAVLMVGIAVATTKATPAAISPYSIAVTPFLQVRAERMDCNMVIIPLMSGVVLVISFRIAPRCSMRRECLICPGASVMGVTAPVFLSHDPGLQ